jgi:hypothetical protein
MLPATKLISTEVGTVEKRKMKNEFMFFPPEMVIKMI